MTNKSEHTKKKILAALEKSLGIVTTACHKAGVGRTLFYKYYNDDDDFKKAVDDIQNVAIDFAESKLHELISSGNASATIFYLKTKGRDRGYVERQEIQQMNNDPIEVQIIDATGKD